MGMYIQLSSFKQNHGLEQLLSDDSSGYWHTDDNLPHYIYVDFEKLTYVSTLCLFIDYSMDESYTPERFTIYYGNTTDYMKLHKEVMVSQENKKQIVTINDFCIKIYVVIENNFQDGRDSHIRGFKVFDKENKQILFKKPKNENSNL